MKRTVLLVEDDDNIRSVVREALEASDFDVVAAGNGLRAKEMLLSGVKPYAVLLDLLMPEMDGREFLRDSEVALLLRDVRVVVMTAGNFDGIDAAVIKVRKPMGYEEILEALG